MPRQDGRAQNVDKDDVGVVVFVDVVGVAVASLCDADFGLTAQSSVKRGK